MNPNTSSSCSLKSRFTRGFLRALIRINRQGRLRRRPTHFFRRYLRVKIAADKSMALAVGSTRAWSRAMLWKIQHKAWRHHHHRAASASASASSSVVIMRSRNLMNKRRRNYILKEREKKSEEDDGFSHAKELRKLVPGGEAMDLCSLLDETAHYIKCLVTQVQVMRDIEDQYYSI